MIPRTTFVGRALLLGTALLLSQAANAAARHQSSPVATALQRFVDDGTIAGAVTLVVRDGREVTLDVVGHADLAAQVPMAPDTLFWIASMTKPITATAVMMLADEGRLSIEDPVEKHLPEFKGQWMVDSATADRKVLVRPPRPVTLRDLLTHTGGLEDIPAPRPHASLAEQVVAYAREPLRFAPGSRWQYCNSGINTLGRVVEVVSGQPYAEFLQRRLFDPLGMKDTTFWPTEKQARRLAKSYEPGTDGKGLRETGIFFIEGSVTSRERAPRPAGGLFSTARDLGRFYQMVLDDGSWKGRRLVSPGTVETMTRTQTGDLKTGFVDGMSFGLGWAVVKEPQGITSLLSRGTFGHGGAYGTQGWVDPEKRLILVLMIQRAKLPNADGSDIRRMFQEVAVGLR
jgi:CubicO group peptidase (beta-lactamase class C family)